MRLQRIREVEVPIGLWLVRFNPCYSSPCNPGEHSDCLEHGCLDNEPDRITEVDAEMIQVTLDNWEELLVDGMNLESNTGDQYGDTHDFRDRLFESDIAAREYMEYTLGRFRNSQPWESFIRL